MYNTRFVLNGSDIYPGYLNKEERQEIRNVYGEKSEYMYCACQSKPKLYYKISKDLKIYPEHNNYVHSKNCCRYADATGKNERKTGYMVDDDTGTATAFLAFDPRVFSVGNDTSSSTGDEYIEEEAPEGEISVIESESTATVKEKTEPNLTLSALLRSIIIDTFTKKILNDEILKSRDAFIREIYIRTKEVFLNRVNKKIGDLSLEKDGVRFICYPFSSIEDVSLNGLRKTYIHVVGLKGEIYKLFIFPETLDRALKKFAKNYNIEPDSHTYLAGFQYLKSTKKRFFYRVLGRIELFQTSDVGLYCRSMIEFNSYNLLHQMVEEDRRLRFWIPAEEEVIGAFIEMKGNDKTIMLLFKSSKAETISFDNNKYIPLVVGKDSPLTKNMIYELFDC